MTLLASIGPLYRDARFGWLVVLNILLGLSSSFALPFMSMFGLIELRMSMLLFGTFMTLNAAAAIVVATALAHYSDIRFSRRSMLLLGSLAGALGYIGYAYLRTFVPLLAVGMIALGISSITFSQLFAYARDLIARSDIPPGQSAFFINVFRMFVALAWTVGPAIGSRVLARFSYHGLFVCAAATLLIFASVVWLGVPPLAATPSAPPRSDGLTTLLLRTDVSAHFAAFVLVTASTTMSMMNLPMLIINTLHAGPAAVGIAYSVAPVFELPFMLYFGWLATRRAAERIIRVGMLLSLAYYAMLVAVTTAWQVYVCQALSAAATSIVAGVAITYFQSHLPHHPGTATNVYSNAQRIGSTAGYFLFVGVAARFGHRAVFAACAGFALMAFALMLVPVRAADDGRRTRRG